mmetsp:Transcript_38254/g.85808  ORF Transcript_38254/g.85808 Transcript_38254/m.85808 type:complete len:256 (-) Transcript_38254:270-1037(-)
MHVSCGTTRAVVASVRASTNVPSTVRCRCSPTWSSTEARPAPIRGPRRTRTRLASWPDLLHIRMLRAKGRIGLVVARVVAGFSVTARLAWSGSTDVAEDHHSVAFVPSTARCAMWVANPAPGASAAAAPRSLWYTVDPGAASGRQSVECSVQSPPVAVTASQPSVLAQTSRHSWESTQNAAPDPVYSSHTARGWNMSTACGRPADPPLALTTAPTTNAGDPASMTTTTVSLVPDSWNVPRASPAGVACVIGSPAA